MTTPKTLIAIDPDDFRAILKEELQALMAPPKPLEDAWMTLKEACQYLRISVPTMRRLRISGLIQGRQLNRRVLFSKAALDAWLNRE